MLPELSKPRDYSIDYRTLVTLRRSVRPGNSHSIGSYSYQKIVKALSF